MSVGSRSHAFSLFLRVRRHQEAALEAIRRQMEAASSVQGFVVQFALAGGTGSGHTAAVAEALADESSKLVLVTTTLHAEGQSEVFVEPYNSVLAWAKLHPVVSVDTLISNDVLASTCRRLGDASPCRTHAAPNALLAQVMSTTTQSMRHDGALMVDLAEIQTSLVWCLRRRFTPSSVFSSLRPGAVSCGALRLLVVQSTSPAYHDQCQ